MEIFSSLKNKEELGGDTVVRGERMKKTAVYCIVLLWISLCSMNVYSRTRPLEYEIQFDSHTKDTYEIKETMQDTFDRLVSGVHSESQSLMIIHNIEMFSYQNVKAKWKDKLILIEGDGKGSVIDGNLEARQYCMEKVQPRSLLMELFGK